MKRILGFAIILSSLAVPAFAAQKNQNITLPEAATIGSTKLPAGEYKISWTGTAPNVQVTLEQKDAGQPRTATLPAKLVAEKHYRNQLTTNKLPGGTTLETVQLKDVTLSFTSTPASGQ
jgi:hypothetical protein